MEAAYINYMIKLTASFTMINLQCGHVNGNWVSPSFNRDRGMGVCVARYMLKISLGGHKLLSVVARLMRVTWHHTQQQAPDPPVKRPPSPMTYDMYSISPPVFGNMHMNEIV